MKKEEALKLITEVCAIYKGNLAEHTGIQTALNLIKESLSESVETLNVKDKK